MLHFCFYLHAAHRAVIALPPHYLHVTLNTHTWFSFFYCVIHPSEHYTWQCTFIQVLRTHMSKLLTMNNHSIWTQALWTNAMCLDTHALQPLCNDSQDFQYLTLYPNVSLLNDINLWKQWGENVTFQSIQMNPASLFAASKVRCLHHVV